jgi:DNA polymerase-3 subunit gamma/tau
MADQKAPKNKKGDDEPKEAHQALYRKYRPQSFDDVIGQESVVAALREAVATNRIGHAYIFSGSRGTGKTTLARIFARAIGTYPEDLYEIDAASNRGIDDVRALRSEVATAPFRSTYKVYIIDEAHMLTKDAWNALLKTLEEPPAHVVFMFATTEKEKLLDTILSRCQHFALKQPTASRLRSYATDIAKTEGVTLDGPAAELIATLGNGSFRDTLSVLEKALLAVRKGDGVTLDDVAESLGAPTTALVNTVLSGIADGVIGDALISVRKADADGIDMSVYMRLVLAKVRAVLVLRYDRSAAADLAKDLSPDDLQFVTRLAEDPQRRINSHTLITLIQAAEEIGYAALPALPIELALLRLAEKEEGKGGK